MSEGMFSDIAVHLLINSYNLNFARIVSENKTQYAVSLTPNFVAQLRINKTCLQDPYYLTGFIKDYSCYFGV